MFPQTTTGGGISEKRDPPDYLLVQIAVYSAFITACTVDAKMTPPGDKRGLSGGPLQLAAAPSLTDLSVNVPQTDGGNRSRCDGSCGERV